MAKKHLLNTDLTEDAFVKRYTSGEDKIGNTPEIINYLRLRHRYYNSNGTMKWPLEAYVKTGLENTLKK